MDFDIRPYNLTGAATSWMMLVGILTLISVGLSFVLSLARNGGSGVAIFTRGLGSYLGDLFSLSFGRIYALTKLTLLEAVRRKALLVFVVFAILLMFAGWFLTDTNSRPELQVSIHVTFLLTAIAWLILPAVIFLSCWALPEDIRIRSLHTVVTKPARRLEIVIGRMAGMGIVACLVLVVMGVIGAVWIYRKLPENSRSQLTCRVPVFGQLYFFDSDGQPAATGINVGDTWMYRSHIAGNSRARAVWMFRDVDESSIVTETVGTGDEAKTVEGLKLECRFEAFRTVKGSEKSVLQGVQAQYTLSSNPREEAFGMLSQGEALRPVADALRDGQFRNGSERFKELATRVRTNPDELRPADYLGLQNGLAVAGAILKDMKIPALMPVQEKFDAASASGIALIRVLQTNNATGASEKPPYAEFADSLETLAGGILENADVLHESLPKLEVPLPAFHISEYHEGAAENITVVPRKLRFAADYETLARFLAGIFEKWSEEGKLVEGSAISSGLVDSLQKDASVSPLNAELLTTVLNEQLTAGTLKISDGKLAVADGRRWFTFFDDLIRKELLISQDSEGWLIEKDLLADLVSNGFLRVEVACLNDQMYLGMARPDLFIRKPDRSFLVGYTKALVSTALMLMLIIVLGVTVSCIVKGPVALFFTLTFFIVGQFFHEFMMRMLSGQEQGMGTLESAVLIAQHRNPQVGMDVSSTTSAVLKGADKGLEGVLRVFSNIVPDFSVFNRGASFVENGFDVPFNDCVVPAIAIFAGFLVPCVLIAGAMLKFRELEAK
jgi:hypothetical protein